MNLLLSVLHTPDMIRMARSDTLITSVGRISPSGNSAPASSPGQACVSNLFRSQSTREDVVTSKHHPQANEYQPWVQSS